MLDEKEKKTKKQTSIQSCLVRARHPKQGREQLLTHMAVFAHTTRKHNTTQHKHLISFRIATRSYPVLFFFFFLFNKGNCSLVKLTMHMLAISPSVSPSNRGVEEERSGAVVGGRGGYRRRFTPGRISTQLARFVLALPASSNVLSHLFDLPVCVSVRRSSRPGCGSVSGLHQSQRLRHGQLVSPPCPPLSVVSFKLTVFALCCVSTPLPIFEKSFSVPRGRGPPSVSSADSFFSFTTRSSRSVIHSANNSPINSCIYKLQMCFPPPFIRADKMARNHLFISFYR